MTTKLTAPQGHIVSFIGSESDPRRRTWIVFGVGYTENAEVIDYARRAGYAITTVDEVPPEHRQAISRLEAYPIQSKYGNPDGADPDAKFRFTGADGHTTVDVRDIINGTTRS